MFSLMGSQRRIGSCLWALSRRKPLAASIISCVAGSTPLRMSLCTEPMQMPSRIAAASAMIVSARGIAREASAPERWSRRCRRRVCTASGSLSRPTRDQAIGRQLSG